MQLPSNNDQTTSNDFSTTCDELTMYQRLAFVKQEGKLSIADRTAKYCRGHVT